MNKLIRRKLIGFTLIELLVVIAIISILATILVPAVQNGLVQAKLASVMSNGRNIYLAIASRDMEDVLSTERAWPASTGKGSDPEEEYADSTAYFEWMVTNGLLNVDFSFFAAPGVSAELSTNVADFAAENNAWAITADVGTSTKDTTPVLMTRNIGDGSGGDLTKLPDPETDSANLNSDVEPFGDKGGVVVRKGGAANKLKKNFDGERFNSSGEDNLILYPE